MVRGTRILALSWLLVGSWYPGAVHASTNVVRNATVELQGASFFEGGWENGQEVDAQTMVDGIFLPTGQPWNQGAVWWDGRDKQERSITIYLDTYYFIEAFSVQADDNDGYILSYLDPDTGLWKNAWNVPNYDTFPNPDASGLQTRPNPTDTTQRFRIAMPIITHALRIEGDPNNSDGIFAVSEVQAFGTLAAEMRIEPETLDLNGTGVFSVFLNLPEGFDESDVLLSSLRCHGATAVGSTVAEDGELEVTFQRSALNAIQTTNAATLILVGNLVDGTPFTGMDAVRVVR